MWVIKLLLVYSIVGTIFVKIIQGINLNNPISACRCYTFMERRHQMKGIFKSPNHSNSYPSDIPCILYIFKGSPGQLVNIEFQNFQMRPQKSRSCVDYLDVYLNLVSINAFGKNNYDHRICTNISHQNEFYSKTNVLILRFHSSAFPQTEFYKGFRGTFQFLSKDSFQNDGQKIIGSQCSRLFFSPASTDWSEGKSGKFFSPNYPQNYDSNMRCQYKFKAQLNERLIITFRTISLDSRIIECSSDGRFDFILVSEQEEEMKYKTLAYLCGFFKYVQIVSHGHDVTVSFISNNNGIQGKGFEAMFEFVAKYKVYATSYINTSLDIQSILKVDNQNLPRIEEIEYYSKVNNYGAISSPNFPETYPNNYEIYYVFYGNSDQYVEIKFSKFKLGSTKECQSYQSDRIEIYDGEISKTMIKMKTPNIIFCGNNGYFYKSQSNYLLLRFISDAEKTEYEQGFYFNYKFITLISSTQVITSTPVKDEKECKYFIHSNGTSRKGKITRYMDRNYLSQHPKICKWILQGTKNQRIVIRLWNSDLQQDSTYGHTFESCRYAKDLKIVSYRSESLIGNIHSDINQWCGADGVYSIMSANIPRMDIIMQLGSLKVNSEKYTEAFHIEYSFVEDFGVLSNGEQINTSCHFRFDSRRFKVGNFSSPNYPGYIPSNIACVYVFIGYTNDQIEISLTEKDPSQSLSLGCSEGNGKVLRFESCSETSSEIPQIICRQNHLKRLTSINWSDNCLRISLISKGTHMNNAFSAQYKFFKKNEFNQKYTKSSSRLDNSLIIINAIIFIHYYYY